MKTDKNKVLIQTGFSCNNNCVICSVAPFRKQYKDPDISSVKNSLLTKRSQGFDAVELTGGEPTARKDIVNVVFFAKASGFTNISITTNGRMFSDEKFCKKIIKAGLSEVSFSLMGDTSVYHEAVTRAKGSFQQTTSGIKHMRRLLGRSRVTINTVMNKYNYGRIRQMARLIRKLGVTHWEIQYLLPEGSAKTAYKKLAVSLDDIRSSFDILNTCADLFDCISFHDFPFCVYTRPMWEKKSFRITSDNDGLFLDADQHASGPSMITMDSAKRTYHTYTRACENCRHKKNCPGICAAYRNAFGPSFVRQQLENFIDNG